ncbi:hypothetical protein P7K49_017397 [Saguinus oedipus]|uniref:Uncharacterized protein n=1 Tax=Saguinus oedipus TaxID=9490 RepID=A0ABQ9V2E2_SAGOE|nr:hypothetical protein P7K49_017397 [Saguinus oedipus]
MASAARSVRREYRRCGKLVGGIHGAVSGSAASQRSQGQCCRQRGPHLGCVSGVGGAIRAGDVQEVYGVSVVGESVTSAARRQCLWCVRGVPGADCIGCVDGARCDKLVWGIHGTVSGSAASQPLTRSVASATRGGVPGADGVGGPGGVPGADGVSGAVPIGSVQRVCSVRASGVSRGSVGRQRRPRHGQRFGGD